MIPEIDALLNEQVKEGEPGAAVAVVQNGEVVHRKGYGLANLEWQIPIQPDTVFRLASVTKQFTTTAIMMLQEQGKLHVSDPLTKFLPKYPTSGHEIQIHHLMNHTSGIKSYTSIEGWFPNKIVHDMAPQAICDGFCQIPFDFKPGTQFLYNNSGYILLGMIIEQVSGVTYEQFIQEQIFRPLGMNQSYYMSNEPIIRQRASGYGRNPQGFHHSAYLSMTQPYAAGSLGSTVDDLVRWATAVRENRLVSAETQALMFTPTTLADGKVEEYGYGWGINSYQGQRFVHHGGGIPGFSTFIAQLLDEPTAVVVLANREDFDSGGITLKIMRQLMGLPPIVRQPISLSAESMERVAGKYLLQKVFPIEVVKEGEELILKTNRPEKLLALSESSFYSADDPEFTIEFSERKDGKFQQLNKAHPIFALDAMRVND